MSISEFIEKRFSGRSACSINVHFFIFNKNENTQLTHSQSGILEEMSHHGFRIATDQVQFESFHLMDCLENTSFLIKVIICNNKEEPVEITGHILWLNRVYDDDTLNFRFGIKFKKKITISEFIKE